MQDIGKRFHFGLTLCPGLIILFIVLINIMDLKEASFEVHTQLERVLRQAEQAVHKSLLPLDNYDVGGSLLIGLGLMIAASGGIGGGGILVPLLIIVFGFKPKYAIPLSNFTILGSSVTNIMMNLPKRHPDADRPLVDWDLILVMEPLTMAGAVSILNNVIITNSTTECYFNQRLLISLRFSSFYHYTSFHSADCWYAHR